MYKLSDVFVSTGMKFFHHQEAMKNMRNGKGQAVVCHLMLTDVCNHTCAFCSVQHRAGDSLPFDTITGFVDILMKHGLKAVILSGGGNPILYKKDGKNFNDVVNALHERGLEIGLITNGMRMVGYGIPPEKGTWKGKPYRGSWLNIRPETLDKLTWIRISMAGLDHEENKVYVPDIDPEKTTLGFSWVAHDVFWEPADKAHGKVSTPADLITLDRTGLRTWTFEERIPELLPQLTHYVKTYKPRYLRLLPNCLEPSKIADRCEVLRGMALHINAIAGYEAAFVQHKPPAAPPACYLGYIHPVLNCDGYVYPCDSVVLNESAGHKFGSPWRMCHWSEIARIYEEPVRSLIDDPKTRCPGCVFTNSNVILGGVVDGTADITPPTEVPEHASFV